MPRVISAFVFLIVILGVAGCSKSSTGPSNGGAPAASSPLTWDRGNWDQANWQ